MNKHILITGGAGFIGSHLVDELKLHGYRIRVLDALVPQVHGAHAKRPAYLNDVAELIVGDIRDPRAVRQALDGVDEVCHLAAMVGVGQSMYEVVKYTEANNLGTAVLLQELIQRPVKRLVVASSMSIYGEGLYRRGDGAVESGTERGLDQLKRRDWELRDESGAVLTPVPTPEAKTPSLASVYALSKYDQERMCLMIGRAYSIPTVALRFFNVYGPRQALSNPYTGVLAIFASRLLNDNPPLIFEDGRQRRDFVSVHDVARAIRLALQSTRAAGKALNIGSGRSFTVNDVASRLGRVLGKPELEPEVSGNYRVGDIRHCFADIGLARELLGYEPAISLDEGLVELAEWLREESAVDRVAEARAELVARGLTV
jgi:dTDP-L-rhamnose 4-epimerase